MTALITYTNNALFTAEEQATLAHAADILKSKLVISEQPALTSPDMVKTFCQHSLAAKEHEVFGVIFLDNQHRVRSTAELFTGTVDAASIYPREVVKKALAENAAAVIFYHNHQAALPSLAKQTAVLPADWSMHWHLLTSRFLTTLLCLLRTSFHSQSAVGFK